jgi:hypothetical protein
MGSKQEAAVRLWSEQSQAESRGEQAMAAAMLIRLAAGDLRRCSFLAREAVAAAAR